MHNNQQNGNSQTERVTDSTKKTRKSLKRFTLILLVIGLILGGFFSVGIVGLMKRWGLTDNTPRINQVEE